MKTDAERTCTFTLADGVALEMIPIQAGSFWMGSPEDEIGRQMPDETLHFVTLTSRYWMGKYPVTQAQYEAVMHTNPSEFCTGGNHPVECVSWYMAMEFCNRLNDRFADQLPEGYKFCLPTEAQWEYACRAGSSTALYNGKNLTCIQACSNLDSLAWYIGNHDERGHLPVGQKEPNEWGLYDMLGNIHEWVYDRYGRYQPRQTDPIGASFSAERVVRGGSWRSPAWRCRAARRGVDAPEYQLNGLGFRASIIRMRQSK